MSSNRTNIYFEIQADDPTRAAGFYSEVFGWQFSAVKGLPVEYWRIAANGSEGGLLRSQRRNLRLRAARMRLSARLRWKVTTQPSARYSSLAERSHCQSSRFPVDAGKGITLIRKVIHSESSKSTRTPVIRGALFDFNLALNGTVLRQTHLAGCRKLVCAMKLPLCSHRQQVQSTPGQPTILLLDSP